MKHKNIKKFSIDGEFLSDSSIPSIRAQYEALLIHDMRGKGYVQMLDIDSLWATEYDETKNTWTFSLSVYGVYIGKKKAKIWEGISSGSLIPRDTQQGT